MKKRLLCGKPLLLTSCDWHWAAFAQLCVESNLAQVHWVYIYSSGGTQKQLLSCHIAAAKISQFLFYIWKLMYIILQYLNYFHILMTMCKTFLYAIKGLHSS